MPVPRRLLLTALLVGSLGLVLSRTGVAALGRAATPRAGLTIERRDAEAAPVPINDLPPPPVTARAAVVLDAAGGAVLLDRNGRQPMAPASLTKIATALVALQRADPAQRVVVRLGPADLDPDGTRMGLDDGEALTVEDLLYGLLLPSGNDAALALAQVVAGSDTAFVRLMNETVAAYGLRDTHFANPHGLDAPDQRTTAADIAQLARVAMRDARFRRIVATESWTVHSQWTYVVRNHNPFLGQYAGADGIKIGWTEAAGATIVASATRGGHRVIAALLETDDRVEDATALLDWAFAHFRWPGDTASPIARALGGADAPGAPP